jgi:hypothetical protein
MNSQNNRVLKYSEGMMGVEEKLLFEEELKNSPQLQKEIANYNTVHALFKDYNEVKTDEVYFRNMVPVFRSKLPGRLKRFPLQKFAFGSASLMIVTMFIFLLVSKQDNSISLTENLNEHDLTELINTYSSETSLIDAPADTAVESSIDNLYIKELNVAPEAASYYLAERRSDLNSVIKDIDQEEADEIYKEIINKKYF